MAAQNFKKTKAFRLAYSVAMEIFEITKAFPKEEKYSLTDQVRRSSRSVCAQLAEAFRKRKRYPEWFVSKVSEADSENSESQVWIHFAYSCKYISKEIHDDLITKSEEIGRLLHHMIENPDKY